MRRRAFLQVIVGSAATWSLADAAEIPRIGYLCFRSHSSADDAFLQSLRALGWIEGQNIYIDRRFAAGDAQLLKDSAVELVHLKLDLIVACASQSTEGS